MDDEREAGGMIRMFLISFVVLLVLGGFLIGYVVKDSVHEIPSCAEQNGTCTDAIPGCPQGQASAPYTCHPGFQLCCTAP